MKRINKGLFQKAKQIPFLKLLKFLKNGIFPLKISCYGREKGGICMPLNLPEGVNHGKMGRLDKSGCNRPG
jgi:hypothetical protein